MCGRGEFTLHPQYARHRMTVDVWRSMTQVQRQRARDRRMNASVYKAARRLSPRMATLRSCTSRGRQEIKPPQTWPCRAYHLRP